MAGSNCDCCVYYVRDEETGAAACEINLDEDEYFRFLSKSFSNCPYFRLDDEYSVVRHQM